MAEHPSAAPAHRAAAFLHARPLALRRDLVGASFAVLEGRLAQQGDQPSLLARVAHQVGLGARRRPAAAATRAEISGERRGFGVVMGGVAIITIDGPLLDRALTYTSWWDDEPVVCIDGYDRIWGAFVEAMSAPDVTAVMLRISSPGGLVSGCFELCDRIAAATDAAGAKPVIAWLDDHAYSAAYALAASCDAILAPRLGGCGSIGVIAVHESYAEFYAAHGIAHTFIESHDLKSAGDEAKPLSADAEAMMREHVMAAASVFTAHVAARRGLSAAEIDGFRAGWFTAEAALDNGLIDAIATFEEVLGGLQADPAALLATLFDPDETNPEAAADPGAAASKESKETETMKTRPKQTAKHRRAGASALADDERDEGRRGETERDEDEAETERDDEDAETEHDEDEAETDREEEEAEDDDKTDESAKIAKSPLAKSHPALAVAAIGSGMSLKQFEASARASGKGGRNQLGARMSGERRLGPDGQRPSGSAAARALDASAIYDRRRAATRSAGRSASMRRDSRGAV